MKGIVLAAGKGTRLYPMTKPVCKPLLPIYDKPLIYYPLSMLMQAGIREVLVIVPPGEVSAFQSLLGDGGHLGMHISFAVQPVAKGIADALLIGREFVGTDNVCLVLGDNLFYAPDFAQVMKSAVKSNQGATVFGYYVEDPRPFGVVEFDENWNVLSLAEKPQEPKSNYIVPGVYFYDNQVMEIAAGLKPSARGELEITDVNLGYLARKQLRVIPLSRQTQWMDAGTADSLLDAAQTIREIQTHTGSQVGCIEELAYQEGWITAETLYALGEAMKTTYYGRHLMAFSRLFSAPCEKSPEVR